MTNEELNKTIKQTNTLIKTIKTTKQKTNEFNIHFANISKKPKSKFHKNQTPKIKKNIKKYINQTTKNNTDAKNITKTELITAIDQLKNKKACGADGIYNEHLKHVGPITLQLILHL
jgi:hypothetical protein